MAFNCTALGISKREGKHDSLSLDKAASLFFGICHTHALNTWLQLLLLFISGSGRKDLGMKFEAPGGEAAL